DEFDVYEITVDGETLEAVLAFRGSQTVFVDPNDPTMTALGVERTATPIENVEFQFSNYDAVFDLNLDRALVNTTLVTIGVVAGQLITSIFGGYAFSRLRFRGRDALFLLYLGSIMIPFVVLVIPMYRLMVTIGWEGKLVSLIVPWIFTAYGTFLMRQFFLSIPKELEEAALMDGASRMRILWTIFVPLSTPAVATLAIFSFLYAWNSFLWPLLIIGEGNEANHVLTLSLIRLSNAFADQPNFVLTGAAVAILPPIIIFVLAQRYFIEGVASSGLKG
ncbi:MAG: carbohydrate ABC transporter permease, partial [Chloroflexota bacterium]